MTNVSNKYNDMIYNDMINNINQIGLEYVNVQNEINKLANKGIKASVQRARRHLLNIRNSTKEARLNVLYYSKRGLTRTDMKELSRKSKYEPQLIDKSELEKAYNENDKLMKFLYNDMLYNYVCNDVNKIIISYLLK